MVLTWFLPRLTIVSAARAASLVAGIVRGVKRMIPQGLKPLEIRDWMARLKPCHDTRPLFYCSCFTAPAQPVVLALLLPLQARGLARLCVES